MKVHLYPLADPNKPEDRCSVPDCVNRAGHWWPYLEIALCQFHYDFPTTKFKDLVDEDKVESMADYDGGFPWE